MVEFGAGIIGNSMNSGLSSGIPKSITPMGKQGADGVFNLYSSFITNIVPEATLQNNK